MDEILSFNDIKPPHHRDFSVAGVKTSDPNDQIEHVVIPELRDREVFYAGYLAGAMTQSTTRKTEAIEVNVFDRWDEILQILIHWKNGRPRATLYSPGLTTSVTALSRTINFTTITPVVRWTKRRRMKALSLHDDPKNTRDFIASQLGCTLQELTDFLGASDERV
jgi:hypothetical protein